MRGLPARDLEHLEGLARSLSERVRARAGTPVQRRRARSLLREAFRIQEENAASREDAEEEEAEAANEKDARSPDATAAGPSVALDLARRLDRLLSAIEGDADARRWSEALADRLGRSAAWHPETIRAERVTLWTNAAEKEEARRRARREWLEARVDAASGVRKTKEDSGDRVALPIDPDELADFELVPTRPRRRRGRR